MSMLARTIVLSLAVATAALLASAPAAAAMVDMRLVSTAPNTCQPALPAFEGVIRKRPLSVQNEGTSNAFVTCSMSAGGTATYSSLYFNSIDGQAHIVSCTVIAGYMTGNPVYLTRSVIAEANGAQSYISVEPADVGDPSTLGSSYISFSCLLPPGTGVNDSAVYWSQYVGA